MIIDDTFLNEFTALILLAEGKRPPAPATWRPMDISVHFLLDVLKGLRNQNVTFDTILVQTAFARLLVEMKPDKPVRYAAAIKFAMKKLKGQADHLFAALRLIPGVEKLSKSQQRYTYEMVEGDHGAGLCAPMALMWLKEQLGFHVTTQFPRLEGKNVLASKRALNVTGTAVAIGAAFTEASARREVVKAEHLAANQLGLVLADVGSKPSFRSVKEVIFDTKPGYPAVHAILITFCRGLHAVALRKENASWFQFYDANAGSNRIPSDKLQAFLVSYNDVCLPLKWPEYDLTMGTAFTACYSVTKR